MEYKFITEHKNIALDIDGVLADFIKPALERVGMTKGNSSWYPTYKLRDREFWVELAKDKEFWLGLNPLISADSLNFEPSNYVTARSIPKEWTEEWLEKNGFPCNPVYVVEAEGGDHGSKANQLKELGVDIFVDDYYKHFLDLNQNGITTFLLDNYYNSRWEIGPFRIKHPNEASDRFDTLENLSTLNLK